MGTNFYRDSEHDGHIGKRSAAGPYCWDCRLTLCKDGETGVHNSSSRWYAACPRCGQKPRTEPLVTSAVGRELGFNNGEPGPQSGVAGCSSFTWAVDPSTFDLTLPVEDEYGRVYPNMRALLSECPIWFYDMIGKEFS